MIRPPAAGLAHRVRARLRGAVRAGRRRAIIEWDYRRFRRAHAEAFTEPHSEGPVALVVSLTEFVYQLKLEGMFLKALALEGYMPVAVVAPGSKLARRYFRAFGVDRFVELPSYVTDAAAAAARHEAEALLFEGATVNTLKDIRFRGAAVGRQTLSTISRNLHEGAVEITAETRPLIESVLAQTIASTLAAEALLDDVQPEIVVFNERHYAEQGPLSDVALQRGLNVIQFVSSFRDDAFVFKRYTEETRGLHPRSLSEASWDAVRRMDWTEERSRELEDDFARRYGGDWFLSRRIQEWTRPVAPEEIVRELGLDASKKTAVLFSHVLWDANMFYGEDLFADQEEWFVESVRAACLNDGLNWIVKLHPANVWKRRYEGREEELGELGILRREIGELPPHVALMKPESDISAWSIFEIADYGITIRGSIGIELPCLGVPVLTAGTGFYSGRGFTIDSATRGEYLTRLASIETIDRLSEQQVEYARRHAYALFRLRPTRFTSFSSVFKSLDKTGHPLDHNLAVHLRTRAEVKQAEDLAKFGRWAARSRALDYLEPLPTPHANDDGSA